MARLVVKLLGSLQVTLDGEPVTGFESDKVRALLAYLAVEKERPQRRERLAGLLWPERPEQAARANLRVALFNLRTVIGDRMAAPPLLCITSQAIQLNPTGDLSVDVADFAALVEMRDIPSLEQAIQLYRGDLLEGFSLPDSAAFEEWLLLTRERLARQAVGALRQVAAHHEAVGIYHQALHYTRREVALDPWAEAAHRRLMRLLARTGQRNAALAQYQSLEQTLARELCVEPEDRTVALYRRIRDKVDSEPPPPTLSHNLPAPLTPFVGRRGELAAIGARLRDPGCRLLTLVGAGGCGKTRLALQAARELGAGENRFPDGLYFVALASLQSCADMVAAIAGALAFPLAAGQQAGAHRPEQQVIDYLQHRRVLLVLDNFEHLIAPDSTGEECLDWLVALLQAAPGVCALVTSRARLNLQAEYLLPVGGMALPGPEARLEEVASCDSVALFVDGARRVRVDLALTPGNAADVVAACRAVDRLPLAILLAASWTATLSPAEIAGRLTGDGREGLDLLAAGWRDVPDRQRSMAAVFGYSWRLLTGSERATVQSLSVFRGSFGRQAALEVTGAPGRDLESLVHKSLLNYAPAGRFFMHELLRQYLATKLAGDPVDREAVLRRYGAYYVRALDRWADEIKGEKQEVALSEMEFEIQNTLAAWEWLVEQGEVGQLEGALDGLCLFFDWRARYRQGEATCRRAVERLAPRARGTGRGQRLLARLLAWQSLFVHYLDGSEPAAPLLEQSLARIEEARLAGAETCAEMAHARWCQGRLLVSRHREQARAAYGESLALCRALGDRWGEANALAALGGVAWNLGDYREARCCHEASLSIRQALGDRRGIADSLMSVGVTALHQGEVDVAGELVQRGCALRQELGDRRGQADGLRHLGVTRLLSGEFGEAVSLLEASLDIYHDLGLRFGLEVAMLGEGLVHSGQYEAGRARAEEALGIARGTGFRRGIGYALLVLGEVALARDAFEEADAYLAESVAVYREIEQWDECCRALATQAYAWRGLGHRPWVPPELLAELQVAVERGAFIPLLWALPVLTLLLADAGQSRRAAELDAEAARYPALTRSAWLAHLLGRPLSIIAKPVPAPAQPLTLPDRVMAVLMDLSSTFLH